MKQSLGAGDAGGRYRADGWHVVATASVKAIIMALG
jgi:hypothetical protein